MTIIIQNDYNYTKLKHYNKELTDKELIKNK